MRLPRVRFTLRSMMVAMALLTPVCWFVERKLRFQRLVEYHYLEDERDGVLHRPEDQDDLAAQIVALLKSPGRGAELGNNAAAMCDRRFHPEIIARPSLIITALLSWFRRQNPDVVTVVAAPSLASQRPTRSDLSPRWFRSFAGQLKQHEGFRAKPKDAKPPEVTT